MQPKSTVDNGIPMHFDISRGRQPKHGEQQRHGSVQSVVHSPGMSDDIPQQMLMISEIGIQHIVQHSDMIGRIILTMGWMSSNCAGPANILPPNPPIKLCKRSPMIGPHNGML
jgi:hypothetical protein